MNTQSKKKHFLFEFLRSCEHGAISTVTTDTKPEVAAMQFAATENLELIFNTKASTRKYKNIQVNNYVAFAIWKKFDTVQYEGLATELGGNRVAEYKEIFYLKNPGMRQSNSIVPDLVFFRIVPKWIRYIGFLQDPWEIELMTP